MNKPCLFVAILYLKIKGKWSLDEVLSNISSGSWHIVFRDFWNHRSDTVLQASEAHPSFTEGKHKLGG